MKTFRFISILMAFTLYLGLSPVLAKTTIISGVVTDQSNQPIMGAKVSIKERQSVVYTDMEGKYKISATMGDILVFNYLGYQRKEVKVNQSTINVQLEPTPPAFMEQIVIGCTNLTKQNHTGNAQLRIRGATSKVGMVYPIPNRWNTEEYAKFSENHFVSVDKDPLSTFGLEVDGASYSNVRRLINQGKKPPKDAIRVEEFLNYFSYDYAKPTNKEPLKINYEIGECPWNTKHKLVQIGLKAKEVDNKNLPKANFVFLIDVSGSMYNSLPLVVSSLKLLVNNIRDEDKIAIVTYAGSAGEALPATSGGDKQKIREALDELTTGGSTAGGAGIKLAYKIAKQNFIEDGNNRIILCTDGDFNVGVSSIEELENLIETERKSGVFLTVLGYGMGNYKDAKMQTLAEKGNGNYAYIDNIQEANKMLVSEFGGTIYTIAKDAKLQIEFNPNKVQAYRLIGYESRLLEHKDFNDDTKDAGEIGAGHTVTAMYEVVPVGVESNVFGSIDPLKYQPTTYKPKQTNNKYPDMMTIKLRWKEPDSDISQKSEVTVIERTSTLSKDFYFASALAMYAQLIKDSEYKGEASFDKVIELAKKGVGEDKNGYRREFIRLVEGSKGLFE